jgi:multidrug efflux pump subunit AcrA (membrane-fusion protein)
MKRTLKMVTALLAMIPLSGALVSGALAQSNCVAPARHHHHTKHEPEVSCQSQMNKLDDIQAQLDALKAQIAAKDAQLAAAQQAADTAAAQAASANSAATSASAAARQVTIDNDQLKASVGDLQTQQNGIQQTIVADQQKIQDEIETPAALHYKGLTITPVAFFAFEGVWRQRSVNSGINTPFNSIPFPSAIEGHTSEFNLSARQSRLGALFQGDAGKYKLSGYFESDFLSAGATSNNNQSNSYTLRVRQIWGKAETANRFAVTAGQTWSLITETGKSTDARTEKLPATIDPQYMVGFSWTRVPTVRFQQQFGQVKTGMFTAAMSLEEDNVVSETAQGPLPANSFFAGAGTGGGLYNSASNYANEVAPAIFVKGTLDYPHAHFELGGLARFFRTVYNPIATTTGTATTDAYTYSANQSKDTKTGGGVYGSARVSPAKFVDIAVQAAAGDGIGRYGSAQLADATLRPDGTLEPIRNYHGLFSLETHPTKKLDVFTYYGGEYAQRTVYQTSTGAQVGYGITTDNDSGCYALPPVAASVNGGSPASPSTCASPTRYIQEGMIGFTYKFINDPKYGRLQYSMTYQYIQRNLWSGATTAVVANAPVPTPSGPRALDNMIHFGMRYYIP